MTKEGNGQSITYRVVISAQTRDLVLNLHQQAIALGIGEAFLNAFREMYSRLQNHPLDFGEPLYRLPALHLKVFQAAISPLAVTYAVHEEMHLVFVRVFNLL